MRLLLPQIRATGVDTDSIAVLLGSKRHWLLDAVYGRDLLKQRVRQLRPDLHAPIWDDAMELDPLLDHVIDELGLRDWQKPSTLAERCRYLRTVPAMMVAMRTRQEMPACDS